MNYKKAWAAFILVTVLSFGVLGYFGSEIYHKAPPIPEKVVDATGKVIYTKSDIQDGQNVWQSIGGMEVGTIWGHGSYVAPDWSADWLHKEAMFMLNKWANAEYQTNYDQLSEEPKAALKARLKKTMRTNTYNVKTGEVVVSEDRAEAINSNANFYSGLFTDNPEMADLRNKYAVPENSVKTEDRMRKMTAFFFWTSWATTTNRPNDEISYTSNWPHEELVDNEPTAPLILWTGISIAVLLAGIGFMTYVYVKKQHKEGEEHLFPTSDPLFGLSLTPSMKAVWKYFLIVTALILVQVILGGITAHYGVEGQGFYGIPLAKFLPYAISRTWHVQLAIFWIATSWLATGLFIAPIIAGKEPKYQKLGVNLLFGALLVIVVGSLAGQWMGVMQKLGYVSNFWFGHQGYEYVDLGRFWQIFLFAGLFIWLFLMGRAIVPALKKSGENKNLLILFLISAIAIGAFYGAGLMWGRQTHLSIVEYWRWWVVHLWVEGFFEVFATVAIAFIFTKMGLLRITTATFSVISAAALYLLGGIIGTLHHLYFSGTPVSVLAMGATFSALEVVPLSLAGFEIYSNLRLSKSSEWIQKYKWPIYSFIAVGFWNLVGAGIFGFMINPPIALYYMQGLNTTPVHGHTALFGVYGMLAIGLMLFVLSLSSKPETWHNKYIKFAFWSINIGLLVMVLLSVLPVGIAQTVASIKHGLWYARSADFLYDPTIQTIKWLRVIGDTIFAAGVVSLGYFIFKLRQIK